MVNSIQTIFRSVPFGHVPLASKTAISCKFKRKSGGKSAKSVHSDPPPFYDY